MARAIWSGAISFGLVNIPVKLYSAVKRQTVRFHQLDSGDNTRIQQKRVNPNTGEEVPYEQLVKGYELSPDRYVVITPEELETVEPEKTRTIDIEAFVELEQIDPIYYDHPYYLAPGPGANKAYGLLLKALEDTDRVGIARVVIRSKEALVAIRAHENVLTMETMLFGDEVVRAVRARRAARPQGREGGQEGGGHGAAADRVAVHRVRPRRLPRHLPRPRAGDDRGQVRGPGDRGARGARGARRGARPDGRAGGLDRRRQAPGRPAARSPRRQEGLVVEGIEQRLQEVGLQAKSKRKTAAKK